MLHLKRKMGSAFVIGVMAAFLPSAALAICEFDGMAADFDFDTMGTEVNGSPGLPKTFDPSRPQAYYDIVDIALNCDEQIGYQLSANAGRLENTSPPPFSATNFTDEIPYTVTISRDRNPARRHNSEDLIGVGETGVFGNTNATTVRIRLDVDRPDGNRRLIAGPYSEILTITLTP